MALSFRKKSGQVLDPVFLKVLEVSQSAVLITVDARIPSGLHTLYEGTPIATCGTAGQYQFMKTALVATLKDEGATRIVIKPPNPFKIGDYVGFDGKTSTTVATVTAVANTYIVTVLTEYAAAKHCVVYQTSTDGATTPKYRPYALLRHPLIVREADGTTCYNVYGTLVHRGTAATSVYKWGFTTDVKNRLGDRIRFQDKNLV